MRRVNVGVIGLGEAAQVIHLPILARLADRYRIAALCDVSPTLLAVLGDRYGVDPSARHADFRDLVAQPDLDAVVVVNSDEYHADCVIAALGHGRHVLVEKPMCLTPAEAEAIIAARDASGVQMMVAYMRRFAPAFTEAVDEVRRMGRINYVRLRDIIGRNRLIVDQANDVHRPGDVPREAAKDRAARAGRLVREAIGEAPPDVAGLYRFLLGLSSHDVSAMREMFGPPRRVLSATHWNGGKFLVAVFEYDGFRALLETGVDEQLRFDAHIEVYGATKSLRVQYDTPYVWQLPTTVVVQETVGDAFTQSVSRPTFKDPYTAELEYFHGVVTENRVPKTTPEDFTTDLSLARAIIDAVRLAGD